MTIYKERRGNMPWPAGPATGWIKAGIIGTAVMIGQASAATPGTSDNGILVQKWSYPLQTSYSGELFCGSAAIADLGPDVNNVGGEPNKDLEINVGTCEYYNYYPELGYTANGIRRTLDSTGSLEWALDTYTDESSSSPIIADIIWDKKGYKHPHKHTLEIAGGTTSGWNVQVFDRLGSYIWNYPTPPRPGGPFAWPSSPAAVDIDHGKNLKGLEIIIASNRIGGGIFALDGDNSDNVDDGITMTNPYFYTFLGTDGVEGQDWDVLWRFDDNGNIRESISSPAVGDIDDDGKLDVVVGAGRYSNGTLYALDARTGTLKWRFSPGTGGVQGSAGLADFDGDGDLEVVIGWGNGNVYFINGDADNNGVIDPGEYTSLATGGAVYSSPAIGDVDGDGDFDAVIGSGDGKVYSIDYVPGTNTATLNWSTSIGTNILSSAALAERCKRPDDDYDDKYIRPWPNFRHDRFNTGFVGARDDYDEFHYGQWFKDSWPHHGDYHHKAKFHDHHKKGCEMGIYIGSNDANLYLLKGSDGSVVDRFLTNANIVAQPSLADIDGDGQLEACFHDGGAGSYGTHAFWCVSDTASDLPKKHHGHHKHDDKHYAHNDHHH